MVIQPRFGSVDHVLDSKFLGSKFFGPGSSSVGMTTADGKTLPQLCAESGLQFMPWHELRQSWGSVAFPSARTQVWISIVDAMIAAGLNYGMMTMAGPSGVGRTSGDPSLTPQSTVGNYPSGSAERGPVWAHDWVAWAAARWGASKCAYWELDNEWATRSQGGIDPYWYIDSQNCADWGTTNFRNYAAQVDSAIPGVRKYGASYSTGAAFNPATTFNPQIHRYIDGTGWANWPWGAVKNTVYGGVSIHSYGSSVGGPPSCQSSVSVATIISNIATLRSQYGTNVATLRSLLTSADIMSNTEWWGLVANAFDSTSLARECAGDIFGFIDHATNAATWNCKALALWGFGPGDVTNPSASPESIISTQAGKLVRRPRYFVIRDILARFANQYPNIVITTTDTGMAISGQSNDGLTGAVIALNLTSTTTTPVVAPTGWGFTVTKTTKLPIPLALDAPLTVSNTPTIPAVDPLGAVLIEGTLTGPPVSGPTTPILDTFTGLALGAALSTRPNWHAGTGSEFVGTGSGTIKNV